MAGAEDIEAAADLEADSAAEAAGEDSADLEAARLAGAVRAGVGRAGHSSDSRA